MYFFSTMALDSVFESLLSILPSCRLSLVCGVYETVGCPIFNFQKGAHNLPSLRISSSQRDYQTIYGEFATKCWTCRRAVFWGKAYNSLVHFSNKPNAVILKSLVSLVRVFSVCVCASSQYRVYTFCVYIRHMLYIFLLYHFQSLSFLAASHFPQCVGVMATACSRAPNTLI